LTKNIFKNLLLFCLGCAAAFLLLELFLVFYTPLAGRVRGGKIILFPYKRYVVENTKFPALEEHIVRSNNSLGLRGEEPPADYKEHLSVIAVGGSTTECFYLSDRKSWPEQLGLRLEKSFSNVWVNNAGMDGHSTFGHAVLLRDYLIGLKPRVIIFLTGANDLGLAGAGPYDRLLTGEGKRKLAARLFFKVLAHSRTLALAQNIYFYFVARKTGLAHSQTDFKIMKPVKAGPELVKTLRAEHAPFAEAYARRLKGLILTARQNGIVPVLATQPLLCGKGRDPETGTDLALLPTNDEFVNCAVKWEILELYNDAARRVAASEKVTLADAAEQLPKSSRNFYDIYHFTAPGAEALAEYIYKDICLAMSKLDPAGYKGGCPAAR